MASPKDPKTEAIQDWLRATDQAFEALRDWQACLRAWQSHPNVTDEAFMQAVQNMSEVGLLEFLEAPNGLDYLRAVVTGEEQ